MPILPEFWRNHEQLIPGSNVDTAWGTRLLYDQELESQASQVIGGGTMGAMGALAPIQN